ncbi:Ankyrin repeats (3 copies) [compost metagenome]
MPPPKEFRLKLKQLTIACLVPCTLILAACSRGPSPEEARAELVKMRIDYDVNTFVERAGASDPVVVKLFLAAGMSANAHNSDNVAALEAASKCGDVMTVRALLDNGADIEHGDPINYAGPAAGYAALKGHTEIAQLLLDRLIAQSPSKEGRLIGDAFQSAIQGKQEATFRSLLNRLKQIANKKELAGELAAGLRYASYWGRAEMVEHLLDQGANIDERDLDGDTPLAIAAANGHLEVVQVLIKKGAQIRSLNKEGKSALFLAEVNGHSEVGNVLAKQGLTMTEKEQEELLEKFDPRPNVFDQFDPSPQPKQKLKP